MKRIFIVFLTTVLIYNSYAQTNRFETIITHKQIDSFYSKVLKKLANNPQCDFKSEYRFRLEESIGSPQALFDIIYKLYGKEKIDELMIFIHVEYIEDIQGIDINMVKLINGQYESNVFTDAVGVHKEISKMHCLDSMKSRLYLLSKPEKLHPCDKELIIFGGFSRKGMIIKFFNLDRYTAKYLMGGC